jgi:hypothetical protein
MGKRVKASEQLQTVGLALAGRGHHASTARREQGRRSAVRRAP